MRQKILDSYLNKYKVLLELRHTYEKGGFPEGTLKYRRVKHYNQEGTAKYYSYLRHQYRADGKTIQVHVSKENAAKYTDMFRKRDAIRENIKGLERETAALGKQVRRNYSRGELDYYRNKVYREWERRNMIKALEEVGEFSCQALDGTLVRSKNECIMANVLYKLGIEYEYEKVLLLKTENGERRFRPDFTVKLNGRELYIELFGQMEDENYCIDTMNKIEIYERNGIMKGKNFLGFYCNDSRKINSMIIEKAFEQVKAGIMPYEIPDLS